MSYLGPCFTVAKADPATCQHPPHALFAWFARDDTVASGTVQCVVCFACDTTVKVGEVSKGKGKRKRKKKDSKRVTYW